jgi:hypothetical protein
MAHSPTGNAVTVPKNGIAGAQPVFGVCQIVIWLSGLPHSAQNLQSVPSFVPHCGQNFQAGVLSG